MKNRKVVIPLLVLALGLWGMIIYKIFARTKNVTLATQAIENTAVFGVPDNADTFKIRNNYPDPFRLEQRIVVRKQDAIEKPKVIVVKHEAVWPELSFRGMMKDEHSVVAFVSMNGSNYVKKLGDTLGTIKIEKIWKDSISVSMNKSMKIIKKN